MRIEQISPSEIWKPYGEFKFIVNGSMYRGETRNPVKVLLSGKTILNYKGK
jgi:hypothetical protein